MTKGDFTMELPAFEPAPTLAAVPAVAGGFDDFNCDLLEDATAAVTAAAANTLTESVDLPTLLTEEPAATPEALEEPYRSRCNTWPRLTISESPAEDSAGAGDAAASAGFNRHAFLQQRLLSKERSRSGDDASDSSFPTLAPLPLVSEEESMNDQANNEEEPNFATSGVRPKTSSRRNPWGNHSYADLITQAIQGSADQRLTLAQIYDWLVKNVAYFRGKGDSVSSIGWKNSIRHNLSLHSRFVRVQNEGAGKSSWWMLNPDTSSTSKAAPAVKHTRRRANTLDTARFEQKRKAKAGKTRRDSFSSKKDLKRATSHTSIRSETTMPTATFVPASDVVSPGGGMYRAHNSPEYEFRPRASSAASSCGGRPLSPFRPRTLSNASSIDHNSPPSEYSLDYTVPLSPWNSSSNNNQSSPPVFNFGDRLTLDDGAQQQQIQQLQTTVMPDPSSPQDQNLTEEDIESLKLLDIGLDPQSSQMILNALCSDEDAAQALQQQQQQQQQQSPPRQEVIKTEMEEDQMMSEEMQPQQVMQNMSPPGQQQNGQKLMILEPRDPTTNASSSSPSSSLSPPPLVDNLNLLSNDAYNVYRQQNNAATTLASTCSTSHLQRELIMRSQSHSQRHIRQLQAIQDHQLRQQLQGSNCGFPSPALQKARYADAATQDAMASFLAPGPPVTSNSFSSVDLPLTTVSESANEGGYDEPGGGFVMIKRENDDEEEEVDFMQNVVDPMTVGGFPSMMSMMGSQN